VKKNKLKIQLNSSGKTPVSDWFHKQLRRFSRGLTQTLSYKKYWLPPLLLVLAGILAWWLSGCWIVQVSFSQKITYPQASVLGINVGNLSEAQLSNQLDNLKKQIESKQITLLNDTKQWTFDATKLGVTFDSKATAQAVIGQEKLSLINKYKLLTGADSPVVKPIINVNIDTCLKELSSIPSVQTEPKDAIIYFDQGIKIKPDQPGTKFNAGETCRDLAKQLVVNSFTIKVSQDITGANLTSAEIEAKMAQIQAMVGQPLSFKSSNGSYRLDLTTEQLLGLIEVSKTETGVQVSWSSSKLDALVNDIATKVNTSDSSNPSLGTCQYLARGGGNWLDTVAVKKMFTNITGDSPRSYELPITYRAPTIGNRSHLPAGSKGTIYLTYDDGMTYANQIMNYASCYGIKVTFFEIGTRVQEDAVALRRAIAEGHAVQSHGYEHAIYDYGDRTYDWQYNDINRSINVITGITGVRPTYFRPPGGNRSANTYAAASTNGINLILWNDASRDSAPTGVTSALTCNNVLAGAYPGASVLMHSTNKSTAEALPCIAEGLAARGYSMQALR